MRLRKCWIPPNSAQGRRVWRGGRPQKQALLHPLRSIQGSCCWTVISSPASTQQRIHWIPKYELFPRSDMRIRGHATMSSLSFLHYMHYIIIAVVCPHHHIMHDVRTHTHTHTPCILDAHVSSSHASPKLRFSGLWNTILTLIVQCLVNRMQMLTQICVCMTSVSFWTMELEDLKQTMVANRPGNAPFGCNDLYWLSWAISYPRCVMPDLEARFKDAALENWFVGHRWQPDCRWLAGRQPCNL